MDWTDFDFEYTFDLGAGGVFEILVSIEASREAANRLVLPPDWREQLDRLNRVRAVHGTTALEGNPLSEDEVARQMLSLDQPVPDEVRKLSKEQLQIRNAGLAQEWTKSRFSQGSQTLAFSDILEIHRMITTDSDVTHNLPGRLRGHEVTVGTADLGGVHRGAPHRELPRLMERYIAFANSRRVMDTHPVIRALLAHFFLVTIHPFGDGNGRVSRLVEAGILYQGGYNLHGFYGLSNYFYRNEREYKMRLQECRRRQPFDLTPFVRFGLEGFASELRGINNFIKTKLNRVIYRAMLVRAFGKRTGKRRRLLNSREYHLLEFLLRATEPTDPFSESPSRRIQLSELRQAPYIQAAYRLVTPRTFVRELTRLGSLEFIRYTPEEFSDAIVELNFDAIGRY